LAYILDFLLLIIFLLAELTLLSSPLFFNAGSGFAPFPFCPLRAFARLACTAGLDGRPGHRGQRSRASIALVLLCKTRPAIEGKGRGQGGAGKKNINKSKKKIKN
jgi:hypothetical protein